MGSHESEGGGHRLIFFTGRERAENEDRDTNESLLKESEQHDDIVQVRLKKHENQLWGNSNFKFLQSVSWI